MNGCAVKTPVWTVTGVFQKDLVLIPTAVMVILACLSLQGFISAQESNLFTDANV